MFPWRGETRLLKLPARTALSHLHAAGIAWDAVLPCVAEFDATELRVLDRQLDRGLNCVDSSSMGRLFDAVSALIGVRQRVSYEGQAAIELESLCEPGQCRTYPALIVPGSPAILDPVPMLNAIVADLRDGIPPAQIATGFHQAIAQWVVAISRMAREETGLNRVGLTGGVFQNIALLRLSMDLLRADGFEVLVHRVVPANDGGLSLGQAALALSR
jgi:hydrogenase maturation protein HypF